MKKYADVHRKQLFHWIGYHIDHPHQEAQPVKLDDSARQKYMAALRGAMKDGLWVKRPRDPDCLGNRARGSHFQVSRPITCFTEWLVGESLPHTTRYGRLGLGFPRRYVFERGGHPLIYVKGIQNGDQYTRNLLTLRRFLEDSRLTGLFDREEIADHQQRLDYITHFAKWARKPPAPRLRQVPGRPRMRVVPRPAGPAEHGIEEARFARSYGSRLELLEEREWRVVYHSTFRRHFQKAPAGSDKPDYYLPFRVGVDLFTVVLPDNRTVNMVMNDPFFVGEFYPLDGPHTTVLSLEDIGTF